MDKELNIILKPQDIVDIEGVIIHRAGYYERIQHHQVNRQGEGCIDEAIFIYCLEGAGWLRTTQETIIVEKGMAIFCDRNTPHAYGTHPENLWTLLWVHFSGPFSDYLSISLKSKNSCCVIPLGYQAQIIQQMHRMVHLLHISVDPLQIQTASSYLKVCMFEVLLHNRQIKSQNLPISSSIHHSIEIMEQHIDCQLTLDEICYEIGLSKYYFSRQFKIITGHSPMTYFNLLKIEKACTLLTSNTNQIQDISAMLGFTTPYYFSETFKQFTGFSPREYKKLHERKY